MVTDTRIGSRFKNGSRSGVCGREIFGPAEDEFVYRDSVNIHSRNRSEAG